MAPTSYPITTLGLADPTTSYNVVITIPLPYHPDSNYHPPHAHKGRTSVVVRPHPDSTKLKEKRPLVRRGKAWSSTRLGSRGVKSLVSYLLKKAKAVHMSRSCGFDGAGYGHEVERLEPYFSIPGPIV